MRRNEERKPVVTNLQTGRYGFKKANGDGRKRTAPAGQTPGPSQGTTRYPRGDTSRSVPLNHETAPQSTEQGTRVQQGSRKKEAPQNDRKETTKRGQEPLNLSDQESQGRK